ncbi:serine/threonine-protein kinase [Gloeothece verrucosa]|uniref:Serine/threonine-protein kinase B n=1 Tax=Gloeothece verrucosa (strain PCC 7822) TaxID=497965 RepID=E0UCK4_GLOV7|nr:serine/threonine-protein kinase [Gloeothece verrucosa]ADN14075.1 serine/threonine protein kinase with pentapeptide repeats [Gloeothece verrucosa PCC 7822]
MSYCVNPSCSNPKNPDNVVVCQACGSKLLLRDRYQVLGILGKGGFGATFATIDTKIPSKPLCVVKQLRPSSDDPNVFRMAKELFVREAQTLDKVGVHPQVPRLLDYFEEAQQFYLVQEYVKGNNLHQEVKKNGPFSEAGVKQFLSELLPILKYIHAQKVIHRDIKPANLIRRQTDKKLVLIDFGAVKNQVNTVVASSNSEQTAFTAFAVGTAGFAPPEQMAMRPVYASDIYAVGVTCIYLLSGKSPKEMGIDPETGELTWESWVEISNGFAEVLKKMLEVSVRHRYKSAQEVLDALELTDYTLSLEQGMIMAGKGEETNMPTQSRASGLITKVNNGIGSGTRSSLPNSSVRNRQNSSIVSSGVSSRTSPAMPSQPLSSHFNKHQPRSSQIDFQVAHTSHLLKGQNGNEQAGLKKKPRFDAHTLLNNYEKGRRDFAQQELKAINLSKAKIPGINLYQAELVRANLQSTDLSGADLGRANLSQAVLKNTNLGQAYLGYANLEQADLRGADLTGANLKFANLKAANLCGANLYEAQVTQEQLAMAKTNWLTVMPSGKRGFW